MMLLNECFPKFLIILRDEIERRRQAKIVPVVREQLHAEAVDGAEEGAVEGGLNFRRAMLFENALSCPLLLSSAAR